MRKNTIMSGGDLVFTLKATTSRVSEFLAF